MVLEDFHYKYRENKELATTNSGALGDEPPDIKKLLRRGRDSVPTNPVTFLQKAEPKTLMAFQRVLLSKNF